LALIAIVPITASAQSLIPGYPAVTAHDPREVARLPNYCRYTQSFRSSVPGGNNQAQIDHWYSVMGETFHAMHHYCWGLMKLNRALYLARSPQIRSFYFGDAILEFDYVLERSSENFALRPEILTKKGQCLIALGRGPVAVPILEHAIELKPDYWPPYVQLSDYYKSSGKIDMAREMLEKAISQAPGVESLKQRLAELDGSHGKQSKGGK
jgi:tetratricopeptide (TPR) repeat protein